MEAATVTAACLRCLESGGIVLTANRRNARVLHQRYDAAQLARGRVVWPAAQVLPPDAGLATPLVAAAMAR